MKGPILAHGNVSLPEVGSFGFLCKKESSTGFIDFHDGDGPAFSMTSELPQRQVNWRPFVEFNSILGFEQLITELSVDYPTSPISYRSSL